jgi:hypothetical protein
MNSLMQNIFRETILSSSSLFSRCFHSKQLLHLFNSHSKRQRMPAVDTIERDSWLQCKPLIAANLTVAALGSNQAGFAGRKLIGTCTPGIICQAELNIRQSHHQKGIITSGRYAFAEYPSILRPVPDLPT